jgi:hypothetical protein
VNTELLDLLLDLAGDDLMGRTTIERSMADS